LQARQNMMKFTGRDGSIPVHVEHIECVFQVLESARAAHCLVGVESHKLRQVDVTISVQVGLRNHGANLFLRGMPTQGFHQLAQFRPRYLQLAQLTRRIVGFACCHCSTSVAEAVVVDVLSSSFSTTGQFVAAADGIQSLFLDANGLWARKLRQIWLGW
jgi:hypothetical protein